jgi:hypothetical protein
VGIIFFIGEKEVRHKGDIEPLLRQTVGLQIRYVDSIGVDVARMEKRNVPDGDDKPQIDEMGIPYER